jgi:hypothetical protein
MAFLIRDEPEFARAIASAAKDNADLASHMATQTVDIAQQRGSG